LSGPVVTDADGIEENATAWTPRERRKLLSFLDTRSGNTWWAPGAIGWWIGVLFAIGATLFALGAAPGFDKAVGGTADAIVYFIGSIFFTSAALLMYVEAVNAGRERFRFFAWEPRDLAFWASLVQLFGTVYFNHSTFAAINTSLNTAAVDHLVWKPDFLGSVCFLIASFFAWQELGRAARVIRGLSWERCASSSRRFYFCPSVPRRAWADGLRLLGRAAIVANGQRSAHQYDPRAPDQ
jgi:hypothetical protein